MQKIKSEIIHFFNWQYLTSSQPEKMKYSLVYVVIFGLCIIGGFVLQYLAEKKKAPRFYKKFLRRVGDFLIYLPLLMLLLVLANLGGVSVFDKPLYLIVVAAIWLIWFLILLYLRLAVNPKMWSEYYHQKREEKYLKNA